MKGLWAFEDLANPERDYKLSEKWYFFLKYTVKLYITYQKGGIRSIMFFLFSQIRDIFAKSHSTLQQIQLSRRAFFQLLGYLASCAVLSLVSQSKSLHWRSWDYTQMMTWENIELSRSHRIQCQSKKIASTRYKMNEASVWIPGDYDFALLESRTSNEDLVLSYCCHFYKGTNIAHIPLHNKK